MHPQRSRPSLADPRGAQTPIGGEDAFVAALNASGGVRWLRLIGSPAADRATAILAQPTGALVTGFVSGNVTLGTLHSSLAGTADALLAGLDASGAPTALRSVGMVNGSTVGRSVVANDALAFVTGSATGGLGPFGPAGGSDAFLFAAARNETAGSVSVVLLGSAHDEVGTGLALTADGKFVVGVGTTTGDLDDQRNAGGIDVYLTAWTADARMKRMDVRLSGSPQDDVPLALGLSAASAPWLSGWTLGNLSGQANHGSADAVVELWACGGNFSDCTPIAPTPSPTAAPTTAPTNGPTAAPSAAPTASPTVPPTRAPSSAPSVAPSAAPTAPTAAPTIALSGAPTEAPTAQPTVSAAPSPAPTAAPTGRQPARHGACRTECGDARRGGGGRQRQQAAHHCQRVGRGRRRTAGCGHRHLRAQTAKQGAKRGHGARCTLPASHAHAP